MEKQEKTEREKGDFSCWLEVLAPLTNHGGSLSSCLKRDNPLLQAEGRRRRGQLSQRAREVAD